MAKKGLDGSTVETLLAQASRADGWTLCIGAGTSSSVFPAWGELVDSLANASGGDSRSAAETLSLRYSPDAIIQAAQHILGLADEPFAALLADRLYDRLQRLAGPADWRVTRRVLAAKAPGDCRNLWREFSAIRERLFKSTTASALAKTIVDAIDAHIGPSAVLSFNAEPLLYALLNHETALRQPSGDALQRFDPVTRSVSTRVATRMPYYYCHGLLPVPGEHARMPLQSTEKLVFAEAQYLNLANNAFSWQSAVFLDVCRATRVAFVGVSLSDPNMRRWLAWTHQNRTAELEQVSQRPANSTRHLWLQKRPTSEAEERWLEALVAHLGVRLVWLNAWTEAGPVLRRMLGLEAS